MSWAFSAAKWRSMMSSPAVIRTAPSLASCPANISLRPLEVKARGKLASFLRRVTVGKTFGLMAVDWEKRVDFDRLRRDRLDRIKGILKASELGSLVCFDPNRSEERRVGKECRARRSR